MVSLRESSLGKEIGYPSHKTFVCLPGPSEPLTRLGSTQRQQDLSSCLLLFSSLSPLPFCFWLICQHNADIQWFVFTSDPEGTRTQTLLMRSWQHNHASRGSIAHTVN